MLCDFTILNIIFKWCCGWWSHRTLWMCATRSNLFDAQGSLCSLLSCQALSYFPLTKKTPIPEESESFLSVESTAMRDKTTEQQRTERQPTKKYVRTTEFKVWIWFVNVNVEKLCFRANYFHCWNWCEHYETQTVQWYIRCHHYQNQCIHSNDIV